MCKSSSIFYMVNVLDLLGILNLSLIFCVKFDLCRLVHLPLKFYFSNNVKIKLIVFFF